MKSHPRKLLCAAVAVSVAACAAPKPPSGSYSDPIEEFDRDRVTSVQVVVGLRPPSGAVSTGVPHGPGSAGKGALGGAVGLPMAMALANPLTILFFPVTAAIGAVAGGTMGALNAEAASQTREQAREMESSMRAWVDGFWKPDRLRSAIVLAANRAGVEGLSEAPGQANAILDVSLVSVEFILQGARGEDPDIWLRVRAEAKLTDAVTGSVLMDARNFLHVAGPLKLSVWRGNDAQRLRSSLAQAYDVLARAIVDDFFLVVRTNWSGIR